MSSWYDAPGGAANSVNDTDTMLVNQGGVSRTVTRGQLLDGVQLKWQGDYSDSRAYKMNHSIRFLGSVYYCMIPTNAGESPTLNPEKWQLLSSKGDTGTLAVGAVTTGAAGSAVVITNVGTPTAAVLDIAIPQGQQGNQGVQGVTGNPYKTYATKAAATADLANIPAEGLIWINNDTGTPANNGFWSKTGGALVQNPNDRVSALDIITQERLRFKSDLLPGRNLFNPADPNCITGYYISQTTGLPAANGTYNASGYIPVVAGTTYISSVGGAATSYQFAWFDANKVYISGGTAGSATAPAGACYIRISISAANQVVFQLEVGASITGYAPWAPSVPSAQIGGGSITELKHAATSVGHRHVKFVQVGKNLFNPNDSDVATGYSPAWNTGLLFANAGYNATGYIPVVAGVEYSISQRNQIAWYDANKVYISGISSPATNNVTAPAGACYLRCSVPQANWALCQVEVGPAPTVYLPYRLTLTTSSGGPILAEPKGASVTGQKLVIGGVDYWHTTFIKTGKNLLNPADADVVLGYYVDQATGRLVSAAGYNTSGYIPVKGGLNYSISNCNQMAWFDANKEYISGVVGGSSPGTFAAPSNAVYMRLMSTTAIWPALQVEQANAPTGYEAFKTYLDVSLPDASVTPAKVNFFSIGKNKFNIADADVVLGKYVIYSTGVLSVNASYNTTGYIPVVAGTTYYLSFKHQIAWFDANKIYISGSNSTDGNNAQTAPVGAVYLRCTVAATTWTTFQVEVGTIATPFESYGYILKQQGGYPIRIESTVAAETDFLTVAPKLYIPYGKEIAIYHENIAKNYKSLYQGKTGISFTGGKETGPSTKIVPVAGQVNTSIAATATVADTDYSTLANKSFNILVSDPTKTTAVNVLNIGDSYTGRMTWANVINATAAAAGLTFIGNRTSNASTPAVKCEGQGGWRMDSYFTVDNGGNLSPFMQPVTAGYLYFGQTSFWIDANSVSPSYNAGYFTGVKSLFSSVTGRKLAPNVGDIMGEAGAYITWSGSAWVAVASGTFGGFAFSFAKYRTAWQIPAPSIVHVLLGTNDFAGASDATVTANYPGYKTNYDAMIASIKADTPAVKIIVAIPVSSGRQGEFGTLATEKAKRAYYLLAKKLTADYGGREAESIYLLDYHSVVDRFYGFDQAAEPPFADYTGSAGTGLYKSDTIHLGADGFKQMGNVYMGLIQYLR